MKFNNFPLDMDLDGTDGLKLSITRPHYSTGHLDHDPPDPLLGCDMSIRFPGGFKPEKFGVIPVEGQTTIPMFDPKPLEMPRPMIGFNDHTSLPRMKLGTPDHAQMLPPPGGPLGGLIR